MAIDRRSFLAALSAAIAAGLTSRSVFAARQSPLYVSSCQGADKAAAVAVFSLNGHMLFSTALPERGHDISIRPFSSDLVVFARRPGDWAAILDRRNGVVSKVVTSPPGRHFYGHGIFSPDGGLLYATENRMETGEGVLGIYDANADYRRVGEMPSFGIGPHDIALLPRSTRMVVANGGIRTHPGTGREILNSDAMEPGLAVIDRQDGNVLQQVDLGAALKGLSIRHIAVTARGHTIFGCQLVGGDMDLSPLVGVMDPQGHTRFLDAPEDDLAAFQNYVGSVALDASGRIAAATSPIGGVVGFWEWESGRFLGRRRMSDVCGVAPGEGPEVFLATSGNAGVRLAPVADATLSPLGGTELGRWIWDNHVRPI